MTISSAKEHRAQLAAQRQRQADVTLSHTLLTIHLPNGGLSFRQRLSIRSWSDM